MDARLEAAGASVHPVAVWSNGLAVPDLVQGLGAQVPHGAVVHAAPDHVAVGLDVQDLAQGAAGKVQAPFFDLPSEHAAGDGTREELVEGGELPSDTRVGVLQDGNRAARVRERHEALGSDLGGDGTVQEG